MAVNKQFTLPEIVKRFTPDIEKAETAVAAPGDGPGFWVGASSAIEFDGNVYIAYRLRQPVELGRGQGVVVAKSADGVHFETLTTIHKESMNAESLERPTLTRTQEGTWRLYLSCATTGTKHWRVELLEAEDPAKLKAESRQVVIPGNAKWGVKDTVIQLRDGVWHCWATMHPLESIGEEDRMVSDYYSSSDGVAWQSHGTCLGPIAGRGWDSRGRRITAVHYSPKGIVAFYDGRASSLENFDERTGIAIGATPDHFESITPDKPVSESKEGKALRYLDIIPLSTGHYRLYYEAALPNGSHELLTELR